MIHVQNSVQEKRQAAKQTQQDLAAAVNVSRQTIIALEKGNYAPSVGLALKIAKHFSCTVDDIFTLEL